MEQFDTALIGGGPVGYIAAIRCAQLGKKTALIENRDLGGTCLNRGCIPTKALLHTAELYSEIKNHGKDMGLLAEGIGFDYAALAARKDAVISRLRRGIEALVKGRKITLIRGSAAFSGPRTLRVSGTEPETALNGGEITIEAANIIIASGSEPASIPVPGADLPVVLNSDAVLSLTRAPESAVIIGGGVIGIEFATLLNSLGKKVTIIEMLPQILNGMDQSICEGMTKILTRRGVEIHTAAKLLEIAQGSGTKTGAICAYEEGGAKKEASGEIVIMAVGRRPVSKTLNLAAAGIAENRGFITVDERLATNVPGIYAIGDVTGKVQLAHVASAQGLVAAAAIAAGADVHKAPKMDYGIIPACVYTSPEIAAVGKTETQVKEAGLPYKTGIFPAAGNGRSLIMNSTEGFVKIITHAETGEILGAHIMASRATDLIGEIALAMKAEATVEELADTIHAHPTVNEMIMEAAHDVEGLCCHKV
ncbi:dihydrolipoyl dehydrogenase [Spirochaetia bacterium]|nr:dihydrolipoyl dehydrogenase [Spirochaetia bacterium]